MSEYASDLVSLGLVVLYFAAVAVIVATLGLWAIGHIFKN